MIREHRVFIAAIGLFVVAAFAFAHPGPVPSAHGAEHAVTIVEPSTDITSWVYEPRVIAVGVGDTVTWTNAGAVPHNVIEPNEAFNSGLMNAGDLFSWTASAAGSFSYVCMFHPWMTGTVMVN